MNIVIVISIILLLMSIALFIYTCKKDWAWRSAFVMMLCMFFVLVITKTLQNSHSNYEFYKEKDIYKNNIEKEVNDHGFTKDIIDEISEYNDKVKDFNSFQSYYLKSFNVPYTIIEYIEYPNFKEEKWNLTEVIYT